MENNITNQEPEKKVVYAGFWWRFLAYLIDEILISMVEWIIVLPILGVMGITIFSMQEAGISEEEMWLWMGPMMGAMFSVIVLSIALNWLYFAIMESSKVQGTVGKMILKIKVTDYEGQRISFGRATGRFFGKIISGMILMIGYIMAGFTEKKQALHDMMAGCLVIREEPS
ncbi:MAG: RDD family protein [Bacteroidales bacterium]|nr:RDD family protein [Bacteroidales bacterium]